MEYGKIERFVSDVLTISAVEREGKEQAVGQALYHALMAAGIYDLMGEEERELTGELMKKLQFFFRSKMSLKERKERKKKENFPPNPLLKEKDKNRKEEKNLSLVGDAILSSQKDDMTMAQGPRLKGHSHLSSTLNARRGEFWQACAARIGKDEKYDSRVVEDFFSYWAQENPKTGKMRFEEQRYWNLDARLKQWISKSYAATDTAAAIRMKRLQKQQVKEQTEAEQQQVQAAQREKADRQREAETEASRKGAVTSDEQIARNPNGVLAQIKREREARERATKKNET